MFQQPNENIFDFFGYFIGIHVSADFICASVWDPVKKRCKILKYGPDKKRFMYLTEWIEKDQVTITIDSLSNILIYIKGIAYTYMQRKMKHSKCNIQRNDALTNVGVVFSCQKGRIGELDQQIIIDVAQRIDLKKTYFIDEQAAVAMAYGLFRFGSKSVLIIDINAENTNISILDISNGNHEIIASEMVPMSGNDIDERLYDFTINQLFTENKISLTSKNLLFNYPNQSSRTFEKDELLQACKLAKIELRNEPSSVVKISEQLWKMIGVMNKGIQSSNGYVGITEIFSDQLDILLSEISLSSLLSTSISSFLVHQSPHLKHPITEVILYGGDSKFKPLQQSICKGIRDGGLGRLGKETMEELCYCIEPTEVVAQGLALRGAMLSGEDMNVIGSTLMVDMVENDIGIMSSISQSMKFIPVLEKGLRLPAHVRFSYPLHFPTGRVVKILLYERVMENNDMIHLTSNQPDIVEIEEKFYFLLNTYDVILPRYMIRTRGNDSVQQTMDIVLEFNMNQNRELSISIAENGEGNRREMEKEEEKEYDSNTILWNEMFIYVTLILLTVIYCYTKFYLEEKG